MLSTVSNFHHAIRIIETHCVLSLNYSKVRRSMLRVDPLDSESTAQEVENANDAARSDVVVIRKQV